MNEQELRSVWRKAKKGVYLVVIDETSEVHIESVAEQMINKELGELDSVADGVVRVFVTEEEAAPYAEYLEVIYQDQYRIVSVPFSGIVKIAVQTSKDRDVRFELSVTEPGEWPRSVDVLWGYGTELN